MAYLKPSAIETKIFNKLAMHSTLWDVHTLEVARRNAVDPQRVPVVPVEYDGSLFVAGIVRVGQKGHFQTYAATEVPAVERSGIVAAYRRKTGRDVKVFWKKLPADSDHPTFKLTPGWGR